MRSRRYDGRANIGSDAVAFSTTLVGEGADEREREGGGAGGGWGEGEGENTPGRAAASRDGDVVQDF